ncbi:transposase domain [Rhizoctonia solani]|uniref:Transposase domain n=1 Tax=Rhizoctonia solani TaxID=456999 RepID=A0A8H8T194_9AGAM|nr:transposase domain [Rhizoctonia solani]QRW26216.1 transposase domain [Rhizoctonia solani]
MQYELAIDWLAHCPRATLEFKVKSFYGQLQRLFYLPLPPNTIINQEEYPKFLILAFILEANITIKNTYKYQVIWYKGKLGSGEVVNAWTIQCAVGRIPDDNKDPTPGKVRPPGQKSNPGRLQESNPQVKVQSLSKIRPPRRPQGSDPQAKSNPQAEIQPWRATEIQPSNGDPTPARVRPQKKTRIQTPPGTGLSHPHPNRAYLPLVGYGFPGIQPPGLDYP